MAIPEIKGAFGLIGFVKPPVVEKKLNWAGPELKSVSILPLTSHALAVGTGLMGVLTSVLVGCCKNRTSVAFTLIAFVVAGEQPQVLVVAPPALAVANKEVHGGGVAVAEDTVNCNCSWSVTVVVKLARSVKVFDPPSGALRFNPENVAVGPLTVISATLVIPSKMASSRMAVELETVKEIADNNVGFASKGLNVEPPSRMINCATAVPSVDDAIDVT